MSKTETKKIIISHKKAWSLKEKFTLASEIKRETLNPENSNIWKLNCGY